MFSNHFHERLFQRCGIVLNDEEQALMLANIRQVLGAQPPGPKEKAVEFEIRLPHRHERFVAVFVVASNRIVTAHKGRGNPNSYHPKRPKIEHTLSKQEIAGKRRRLGRSPMSGGRPRVDD